MSAQRAPQPGDVMRYKPNDMNCLYVVLEAVPMWAHRVRWLCTCHAHIEDQQLDDAGIMQYDMLVAP